jgi:HK97 family phage portal protein
VIAQGLRTRIANILLGEKQSLSTPALGTAQVWNQGGWWPRVLESFTGAWQRNVEIRRDLVLAYFAVYACITRIAGDIGKLRPMLMELDGDGIPVEITAPAFTPLLTRPNQYQTWQKFIEFWLACKLIHGNAYIFLRRDNRQVVISMHVLDPQRVRVLVAPDGGVYYALHADDLAQLRPEDAELVVPASEIIHDPMVTLFHPLMGVSPLFASGLAATQGLSIQNNSALFFKNMSRPSGILVAPVEIDDSTAERIRRQWDANYGGDKLGKTAVLGDGLKYQEIGINAVDAELVDQLKITAEQVCSTFHVPGYMVGVGNPPSFNNVAALNQQYYSQCLQVLIESVEAHLNHALGFDGRRRFVELDLDDLIRMDTATQIETLVKEVNGTIRSPNEARKKRRLPPIAGGDTVYMQQQNYSLAALDARDRSAPPENTLNNETPEPEPAEAERAAAALVKGLLTRFRAQAETHGA